MRPLKTLPPKSGPTFIRGAILPPISRSPLHNRDLPVCLPNSSQSLPPSTLGPHAHHPSQSKPPPLITSWIPGTTSSVIPQIPGRTPSVIPQISVCFPLEIVLSVWPFLHCTVMILSLPTQQFLTEEVNLLLSYQSFLFTTAVLPPPSIISPHDFPPLSAPAAVNISQVWSPHTHP